MGRLQLCIGDNSTRDLITPDDYRFPGMAYPLDEGPGDGTMKDGAQTPTAPVVCMAPFIPLEFRCHSKRAAVRAGRSVTLASSREVPGRPPLPGLVPMGENESAKAAPNPPPAGEPAQPAKRPVRTANASKGMTRMVAVAVTAVLGAGLGIWLATSKPETKPPADDARQVGPAHGVSPSKAGPSGRVQFIAERAAGVLNESFQDGMAAWSVPAKASAGGWSKRRGSMATGELALFQPSLHDSDYRLEFLAQIERKSLGWVVRAKDRSNYYATKLAVVEARPRPYYTVEHYAVIDGKKIAGVVSPLTVSPDQRRPYQVAVEVRGDRIDTWIEGEKVDSWTDTRLRSGGIGFFSDAGERGLLYWVTISKNQDFLGKVCAMLVPFVQ